MQGVTSRLVARPLFAVAALAAALAAFLRGNFLLGVACGIVYIAITLALFWLLVRSRRPDGRVSVARVGTVVAFALPVGYAMAFPASINPIVQVSIDAQALDRRAQGELAAVFGSDPGFRDLSVSSVHLKALNLTIQGSLAAQADLDRLRSRIAAECPALDECCLLWEVSLRDSGRQVNGIDRDLFEEAEPHDAPDQGRR